ncbi:MAG TPA: cellulose synthase family protein [Anaerolineales bacterium]|nr:cellulose synthase family protein [Anaerolineales bacterium]
MIDFMFIPIAVVYLSVVLLLLVYGINLIYLTSISLRRKTPLIPPPEPDSWPLVTVQLPIYNEIYVAERLIRAAAGIDYPPHLLEIQVLDDSTDETTSMVEEVVARLRAENRMITCLHRTNRVGFKSGALAEGMGHARGEFIAIFDADFIPPRDFLKRTLPYFRDPRLGYIQTRWGYTNRNYSYLTYLQALAIDAHFMIEQHARSQSGYFFNFNGSAGIWRKSTIIDAGGWKSDTLTEDLDLSYRAILKGWQGLYLRDLVSPAELPVSITAFRRQQYRWARGSLECAGKYLPVIWDLSIPLSKKIEASLHLLGYGVHLLLCLLVLLNPLVLALSLRYAGLVSLFGIAVVFNLATFAQAFFLLAAQKQVGKQWWKSVPMVMLMTAAGTGMMVNTARAAIDIIRGKVVGFERTPKYGIIQKEQAWVNQRYQVAEDSIIFFELAFALLNAGTAIAAAIHQNWIIAIYACFFCAGLLIIAGLSIRQAYEISHPSVSDG